MKTNRYILGLRSKGFLFCFGGEGRCGENRGRKWNSNCAGGHRAEKYWKVLFPPRSSPDPLKRAALLPSGSQGDMNIAICHSHKKLHLSDRLDQLPFFFFFFLAQNLQQMGDRGLCTSPIPPPPAQQQGLLQFQVTQPTLPARRSLNTAHLAEGAGVPPSFRDRVALKGTARVPSFAAWGAVQGAQRHAGESSPGANTSPRPRGPPSWRTQPHEMLRAAGAGQLVFPRGRLITNKAMCARYTGIPQ